MRKPAVSIIIPTYNRANLLKEAIQSAIKQSYSNIIEIIITDDNSTDNTEEIVKEFQKRERKIKYIKNIPGRRGVLSNKNNGIRNAKGDFIFILDDDDVLYPDAIKILVDAYLMHPECNIIIANRERSDTGGWAGTGLKRDGYVYYRDILCDRLKGNFVGIIKRDILKAGFLDTDLKIGGESLLWKELHKNNIAYYVHKKIMLYRIGHVSLISQRDNNPGEAIKIYQALINRFKEDYIKLCPKSLARLYANLGYFQFISGNRKNARESLLYSLKAGINLRALILLIFSLFFSSKSLLRIKVFLFKILRKY